MVISVRDTIFGDRFSSSIPLLVSGTLFAEDSNWRELLLVSLDTNRIRVK